MTSANTETPPRAVGAAAAATGMAIVTALDALRDSYVLDAEPAEHRAWRASSCLVLPAVGDTVSWLATADGDCFITAVLRRQDGNAALTVSLPPGSAIEAGAGTLELRADALALRARALSVEGEQAHLSVEHITAVGRKASWSFGVVRLTAELVESFAERLLQFSRWSQRLVDGPDQVRSRQIDWRAEQTLQLQAEVVITNADKLLKADGEQIHLG